MVSEVTVWVVTLLRESMSHLHQAQTATASEVMVLVVMVSEVTVWVVTQSKESMSHLHQAQTATASEVTV